MRERKYAAAILTSPFDLIAKTNGFNVLQYARDVYGHYEESVAVTRRAWAAANEQKLVAYSKTYVLAVEWLRDPINKDEAILILRKHFRNYHRNWRRPLTQISSAPGGLPQKRNSTSRAFVRCWSCAANTATRRRLSPIPLAITISDNPRKIVLNFQSQSDKSLGLNPNF